MHRVLNRSLIKEELEVDTTYQTQSHGHDINCEVKALHYVTQLLQAKKNSPLLLLKKKTQIHRSYVIL